MAKQITVMLVFLSLASAALSVDVDKTFTRLDALCVEQTGTVPDGAAQTGVVVLANEPNSNASISMDFDLGSVSYAVTPLAQRLTDMAKLEVKREGQKPGGERGALHVYAKLTNSKTVELVGSLPVSPAGIPYSYAIDVTRVVNDVLVRPAGQRKLRLEVRMEGKPCFYEVYGLPVGAGKTPVTLELASPANWTQDSAQRVAPVTSGQVVYREACMPITTNRKADMTLPLMYPARKIIEVIHDGTGEKLQEGRDWVLRDGKLVLPSGSHVPIQLDVEFFARQVKPDANGVAKPSSVSATSKPPALLSYRLEEGTWYHDRQIEVTYELAKRDWSFPPPRSSLDNLPRLKKLLTAKAPVRIVLFGDSISLGGNASKFQGCWPYQPIFGELVAWELEQYYGSKITFMNHSRGGAGAAFGASQAESQVGWFKPDLAIIGYGMNDRGEKRRGTYRESLEKIIDAIRRQSPETEIIIVTSMLNNPKQPSGLEPVLFLRDEALKISRPGLAFVDMTSTHLELIKHKNYLDTSGNGANHPNDFLHRIYAQRLLEVLIPEKK